jgi:16S rRNA processing protein RimM
MIAVGRITKSVGIKGELNVAVLTDNPKRFEKLKSVWIGTDEAGAERYTVLSVRMSRSGVVLKTKEIQSRLAAEAQRGRFVFAAAKDAITLTRGSYFIHDIVGMNVLTEAGEQIGIVRDVMQLPANDVWVVAAGEKEILIPAMKEVIRSVDVQRRVIVIRPMEGLLE